MEPDVARAYARTVHEEEIDLLRTLAQIPAPTGCEEARVAFVVKWLRNAGATCVEVDAQKNVLCWLGEVPAANVEVFSAHTDVVFDDRGALPLREEDGRLHAPGVGDDTANLVGLLLATRWLIAHPEAVAGRSILVLINSCEEGLGNLRGTRAVYDKYESCIASHVAFDTYLGNVVREAVGSVRWRVSCDGPGGHSFKRFGTPNAIVELARLVLDLDGMELPAAATTTQNAGVICGGTTVNSIAEHAEMLYELRSVDDGCLRAARAEFERVVDAHRVAHANDGVSFCVEPIGQRPGNGPVDAAALDALTARACDATRVASGRDHVTIAPSSTDANIPLSCGIPAVCMGAVRGAGAHTRDEWIETSSLEDGLVAILLMMAARV